MESDIFGLTWVISFYIASYIAWSVANRKDIGPFKTFLCIFGIIGVIIHEPQEIGVEEARMVR